MELDRILAAGAALVVTLLTWFFNEQSKRSDELYKLKEARYGKLVSDLKGFFVPVPTHVTKPSGEVELVDRAEWNRKLVEDFLEEVNSCWLYCSDDVIRNAYHFVETVQLDEPHPHTRRQRASGELLVAIRNDIERNTFSRLINNWMRRRSRLKPEDFKHLRATPEGGDHTH